MKISELSDSDLSRWIAEKIEPLMDLPNPDECDYSDMESFDAKCWIASYRLSPITLMHVPEWVSCDMVHDPAMTVMLLETLLRNREYKQVLLDAEPVRPGECEEDHERCIFRHLHLFIHERPTGRCIAEQFALENGWKE